MSTINLILEHLNESKVLSKEDAKKLEDILLKAFKNPKIKLEEDVDSPRVWTPDEIKALVQTNDKVLYGALKHLYACQTESEKSTSSTHEHNGKGFNATDAEFLTSICQQLEKRGTLSPKQKEVARKKLVKYNKQITNLANEYSRKKG